MILNLLDGRKIDSDDVVLDPVSQRVYYRSTDITTLVVRNEKKSLDGFDEGLDNLRLSNERYAREHQGGIQPETGSTSTANIFFDQVTTDPLNAPIEAANRKLNQVFSGSGFQTLGIILVIGVIGYIAVKNA